MTSILKVNGFNVRSDFEDKEPRIQDLELAKRLGYARPRNIRNLIHSEMENLNVIAQSCVAQRRADGLPSKPSTEYWLDERSAIFVIAKSGTPTANAILREVIEVFVRLRRGEIRTHPLLCDDYTPWELMFPASLVKALCSLYGEPYTGRSPRFLGSVYVKIYKLITDGDCYAEMKKRNPAPRHGSNHHQMLTTDANKQFRAHLKVVEATARSCVSVEEFWSRTEAGYAGRPLQLPLVSP